MNNTALRLVAASAVYFLSILLTVPAHALPPGSGSLYFVHNNANGTPQALTDEAGDVVWSAQTDPFGAAEVDEDPDGNGQNIEFNVRAPGQYHDKESGLHYNYYRYYDPGTGRYLTSDPIGLNAGPNTFVYVEGNPITNIDPLGLLKLTLTFGGGLFLGAFGGTAESGIGFDDKGNVCFLVVNCKNKSTIGPGFASLGGAVSAEKGEFCEGASISDSEIGILDLGIGSVGGFSVNTDANGNPVGGSKAFAGLGAAMGVGTLNCETRRFCTNPFK